jgi:hypothetical protein
VKSARAVEEPICYDVGNGSRFPFKGRRRGKIAMDDPRLLSVHFGFDPRREQYRQAREALLNARGLATRGLEYMQDLAGDSDVWPALLPIRPEQLLPGTKFALVDPESQHIYPLHVGLNTLGRLPDNDIVLEEIWISRRHGVVLVHARGACELHDMASRNGTFVNGQRIHQPVALQAGDEIKLSKRRLLFVREADCHGGDDYDNHPRTAVDIPCNPPSSKTEQP